MDTLVSILFVIRSVLYCARNIHPLTTRDINGIAPTKPMDQPGCMSTFDVSDLQV